MTEKARIRIAEAAREVLAVLADIGMGGRNAVPVRRIAAALPRFSEGEVNRAVDGLWATRRIVHVWKSGIGSAYRLARPATPATAPATPPETPVPDQSPAPGGVPPT